ncbi:hypothetical protein Avbf_10618 [Armadillidium vulgare]|nr:hypothetical protein Avbf_10618 [Armadillidium vulgare]
MFHYQHQKQQMIALEKFFYITLYIISDSIFALMRNFVTLFWCRFESSAQLEYGLKREPKNTDEMEVKNPLFSDDPTPATPGRQQKDEEERKKEVQKNDDEDEEELENH